MVRLEQVAVWEDKLNKDGILLMDTYHLDYYGINVFLQVCKTDYDAVAVYELATKNKKIDGFDCTIFTKKIKESKRPIVVPKEENTWRKSNYWVIPVENCGDICLPIEVGYNSPLYNEAVKAGTDYPVFGTAYAYKIKEYKKYYWFKKVRTYLA